MKKLLIGMLIPALAAFTINSWAGPHGKRQGGQMDPERRAQMQERLGLTEEQMNQMREIRENGGSREDVRAVLTDEQRSMIDEHRRNRQAQGGQGKGRNHPPGRQGAPESSSDG